MFKSLGFGICCVALGFSGICRASVLPIDGGKFGDDKCFKLPTECKVDVKGCDFKGLDLKLDLGKGEIIKDIVDGLKDKGHDGKDVCKMDWHKITLPKLCDIGDKHGKDRCDLVIDRCDFHFDCDHHEHGCGPAAVPAPSAAAFGGLGIAGVMAMAGLRKRRSVIC